MIEFEFIAAIILTNIIAYWPTFKFGLIVDDMAWYEKVKKDNFFDGWKGMPFPRNIAYMIQQRLYGGATLGLNKKIDHIFATILQTTVCVLMYFAFGRNNISFCAALLYAINPINNQTAVWLNGRRYIINIILVLLIMILGKWGLVLYPLTTLFQVSAIFAPILLGWFGIFVVPLFLVLGWKEILYKINFRKKIIHNDDTKTFTMKKLIPITKIYGAYVSKMVFPGRTMFIYGLLYYWGMTKEGNDDAYSFNKSFWLGCVAIVLSVAGLFYFKGQMFWWFAFMILSTLQWSGFISVTQIYTDRYVSLPNVFMMYFLSYFIYTFGGNYTIAIVLSFLVYYSESLKITLTMYKDVWAFYNYHIQWLPWAPKCREFKAARCFADKDVLGAWDIVKEGLKLTPKDMKLNMIAAQCMKMLDDKEMVFYYLKEAKKNVYIGQEFILEDFINRIFGVNFKIELDNIKNKKSKFDRKQRETLERISQALAV